MKIGYIVVTVCGLLTAACQSSPGPWLMQNGQPWLTPDGQCVAMRPLKPDEKKGFCYDVMTNNYQQEHHYEPLANDEFSSMFPKPDPIPASVADLPPPPELPSLAAVVGEVSPVPHPDNAATSQPFHINSARLAKQNRDDLGTTFRGWKQQGLEVVSVAVTGHTDSSGPLAYNNLLSYWRAQSVAYFLKHGLSISEESIKLAGAGPSIPNPNARTPEENRYVDLVVWLQPAPQKVAVR